MSFLYVEVMGRLNSFHVYIDASNFSSLHVDRAWWVLCLNVVENDRSLLLHEGRSSYA